jgi:hypothetical protein
MFYLIENFYIPYDTDLTAKAKPENISKSSHACYSI